MEENLTLELSDGFKLVVRNSLHVTSTYVFLELDTWFEDEPPFIKAFLQPGMKVIDIGANYGYYTILASQKVGTAGKVWAFEPGADAAALLRQSIEVNGAANVRLIEKALGDESSVGWLTNHASPEYNAVLDEFAEGARSVVIDSLDNLDREENFTGIDFIKIDAEGFEEKVITGGLELFRRENPLVMIEISLDAEALKILKDMGYKEYRLISGVNALISFDVETNDWSESLLAPLNVFLCKPDREETLRAAGLLLSEEDCRTHYPPADPKLFIDYYLNLPVVKNSPVLSAAVHDCHELDYLTACAEFVCSQDKMRPVTERYVRLARANEWFNLQKPRSLCQYISAGSVFQAYDRNVLAMYEFRYAFEKLVDHPGAEAEIQPFLPIARYETMPIIEGKIRPWLLAMTVEGCEFSGSPSSYFHEAGTVFYFLLAEFGYLDEVAERRAALKGLSQKKDLLPEPVFIDKGPRLNAEIWLKLAVLWRMGARTVDVIVDAAEVVSPPASG
jgi:FkbM family methyltransferase